MEREDLAWEERSILILEKRKGNRRKKSGFSWADWVWEVDTNIRRKGTGIWGRIMRIRGSSGREGDTQKRILRIFGSEEQRKRRKSNCNQGYPRYAFRYSWNFYPCSIFQRVCFWIFIVLLILVWTQRGHSLICWDWFACIFVLF